MRKKIDMKNNAQTINNYFMPYFEIETNLDKIFSLSITKEDENIRFRDFLSQRNSETIDAEVMKLNNNITPKINCTECGNCCKSLMINVTEIEADALSAHLKLTRNAFDEKNLEKGVSMMVMNAIPCNFLDNNICTVYEYRFSGCKEFPAMHLPDFNKRLFTTFMHYSRCPIIYNVVEGLKVKTGFI